MLLLYSGYLYMSVFYVFSYFFFFKQKTAYEMLISDWSSDVCSSDLGQFAILGDDRWAGRPHGVYKMLSSGGERSRDDDDCVYAKGAHLHADYFGQDVPGGLRGRVRSETRLRDVGGGASGLDKRSVGSGERRVGNDGVSTGKSRWA